MAALEAPTNPLDEATVRHFSILLLAALAALAGCKDTPADSASPAGPTTYGDCTSEIWIPAGVLEDDPVPADAHEETYGADPAPWHVRYQWPDIDPSKSAAFLWRTDTDTLASALELGPADGFPDNATRYEGASFLFGGGAVGAGDHRIHEVRVCGALTPGEVYSYRVGGEGGWSDTFSFSAPGAPGSFDTFRVAVAGDSRGAYDTWGQVVAAMDSHAPDFFLFSGDMVEFGTTQSEWDDWFAAAGDVFAQKALVPAHGNHEFLAQNYFAQFALPGNEEWFAVEYGDLLVVSLNDTQSAEAVEVEQVAFLEAALPASDARWKVAVHHQSAYSVCTTHDSNETVRAAWTPSFDAHGVDIAFAGHNHIFERSVPVKAGAEVPVGEGTVYYVSGGAGAPLYTGVDEKWFGDVYATVEHYLIADFAPDGVHIVARDLSGNVLDEFSIPR